MAELNSKKEQIGDLIIELKHIQDTLKSANILGVNSDNIALIAVEIQRNLILKRGLEAGVGKIPSPLEAIAMNLGQNAL